MKPTAIQIRGHPARGYILYFVILSLAVLSVMAGQILLRIRSSYRAIHRAANWQQALATADSGVDMAIAQLSSVLPDVRQTTEETVGLSVNSFWAAGLNLGFTLQPGASALPVDLDVQLIPPPLMSHGEGNTTQQASISIKAVAVDAQPNPALGLSPGELTLQLVRIRSTGIAYLDSSQSAGYEKDENALRRPVLVWDRNANQFVDRPFVARTVEVILRPTLPFRTGVGSVGDLRVDSEDAAFDSFNSCLSTASTLGAYDPAKRLENTTLQAGSSQLTLAAPVHGDVTTNGGSYANTGNVTGTVDNGRYNPTPALKSPTWSGNPAAPASVTAPTTLDAGSALIPARYKFGAVASDLHITRGALNLGSNVDIWVAGDFTGRLILDPGVKARVYVEGDIAAPADGWQNGTHVAANLQIYGLKPQPGKGHMSFSLTNGMEACLYAPEHDLIFTGGGDFSGSVTGGSVWIKSSAKFHYDETLALNAGPILRYSLVSWRELPSP